MIKAWADRNLKGDPAIWVIVILLSLLSVMVVYSATGTLAYKNLGGDTEHYLLRHSFLITPEYQDLLYGFLCPY